MKSNDIKRHLSPYSIYQQRRTTINHTFASALAPCDIYDSFKINQALTLLCQDHNELICVYCGEEAQTWDHLVGLVKDSHLNGYGHQIGNLVPCCKNCNSKKGNRDWREFLKNITKDNEDYILKEQRIYSYLTAYAKEIDLSKLTMEIDKWNRYNEIKQEILDLMHEADELAAVLRSKLI